MPIVNKISGLENNYTGQNKVPFKSKFVANEALHDAFFCAHADVIWTSDWRYAYARSFAKIIEHLLNDGKDDLIKVTRSKTGSSLTINGERVNFHRESPCSPAQVDGGRVINNIVEYFTKKEIVDTSKLLPEELKAVKPGINTLNADLNADDVTKNPRILYNLENNLCNINATLHELTDKLLEKLESTIFKG